MNREKLLVGFVVDISQSMRRNWKNKDGRLAPKIEVIKDSFNDFFQSTAEFLESLKSDREVKIFCLGMGFQLDETYRSLELLDGQEKLVEGEFTTVRNLSIVCDLVALSEMIPNRKFLDQLREELNTMWNKYAQDILKEKEIDPLVTEELKRHLQYIFYERSTRTWLFKLHKYVQAENQGFFNKNLKRLILLLKPKLRHWPQEINRVAGDEIERYLQEVTKYSRQLFHQKKQEYFRYIERALDGFITAQVDFILDRQSLGFSFESILSYFDRRKAEEIATNIFRYLEKDVKKQFTLSQKLQNWGILLRRAAYLGTRVNLLRIRNLTEACVKLEGNLAIKPFVQEKVLNLFSEKFNQRVKTKAPYWISLARQREVYRSVRELKAVLPETAENNIYSSDFMFGSTPIQNTMDKTAMRLFDPAFTDWKKVIVIVSDGEFEQSQTVRVLDIAKMLKKDGITIISCLVTDRGVRAQLFSRMKSTWSKGAQTMFALASQINQMPGLQKALKEESPEAKLFFRINDSESLEKVLELVIKN